MACCALRNRDRYRESNPLLAARLVRDDAEDLPILGQQRASAVAGIDRDVDLDHRHGPDAAPERKCSALPVAGVHDDDALQRPCDHGALLGRRRRRDRVQPGYHGGGHYQTDDPHAFAVLIARSEYAITVAPICTWSPSRSTCV